jgi:CHAT domain-containing protein/Tfp pilus assembly protein PilF
MKFICRYWRRFCPAFILVVVLGFSTAVVAGPQQECAALFERGNQAYRQGDYPKAVSYLERAAQMAEGAFGANHPNVSLVYNALSTAYLAQGRYNDAEPFLLRALQIRERNVGPNSPDLVPPLSNAALMYDNQGRYADAEAFYKRALSIQEAADPNHPNVATTLGNFANLYQHMGRYGEAERAYLRAQGIVEKTFGPEHPNVVFIIDNLAVLYGNEGRHDDATKLFQRSLAIKEKAYGPNSQAVVLTLNNIAEIYDRDGRFADAEELFRRVLSISEGNRDAGNIAAALNNLAAFCRARNRLTDAEPLYQRALTLQQQARGPNHPDVATVLANIAVLYDKEGRSADSEQLYKRSLAIDQAAYGADSDPSASDMYALALLYDRLGRAGEAETLMKRALAIREKSTFYNPGNIALSLGGLARFYDHQGRLGEALTTARRAVSIWVHGGAVNWNPDAAGHTDERMMREFAPELIRILYQAYDKLGTHPIEIVDEAFRASQSARGLDTAQALAGMTARYAAGSDALGQLIREQQDLNNRSQALNSALIRVLSMPPSQRSPQAENALRAEQRAVEDRLKADDGRLRKEFPRFVELARAEPVSVAGVQQVLGDDEAFTAMTLGETDSYLFVIRKDRADFFKLDLTRAQASDVVKALRAKLLDDAPFDAAKASDLYKRLLGPADSDIGDAKNLIVVPDGALESLPLAVLITAPSSDGQTTDYKRVAWLIRRQAITIQPAASSFVSLRNLAPTRRAEAPFAGFGNPDFRGTGAHRGIDTLSLYRGSEAIAERLHGLPSLPETAAELRAEAKMLGAPETSLHLGADASVTTVKSIDLSNTRVIAFATHAGLAGELAEVNEPMLVLTPPLHPTREDDGLLRASQVSQLRLNADFVILSACNTAASDGTPGAEGLTGLAKAFFYAGARSLLVSHWEVQSEPTVKLTTGLIRALTIDPAIGRSEALRRSILAMIDSASDAENHPIAWAPFVLAGEGGAKR